MNANPPFFTPAPQGCGALRFYIKILILNIKLNGGSERIRTSDELPHTRFPSVRLQPLGHTSVARLLAHIRRFEKPLRHLVPQHSRAAAPKALPAQAKSAISEAMPAHLQPPPPALSPRLTFWISAALVVFLYICFVGVVPFASRDTISVEDISSSGDLVKQIVLLTITTCMLYTLGFKGIRQVIDKDSLFIILFFVICFVSSLWASEAFTSLRRSIYAACVIFCVFSFVSKLGFNKVLEISSWTLLIMIAISVCSIPILDNAVHQAGDRGNVDLIGNWRGLFFHKNITGSLAAIAIINFITMYKIKREFFWLICLLPASVLLVGSMAKTSIGLIVPAIVFSQVFVIFNYKINNSKGLVSTLLIFIIMSVLTLSLIYFSSKLNDPEAFTGRVKIWETVWEISMLKPLLGYGYGSVFEIVDYNSVLFNMGFEWLLLLSHSHNGYLHILIQLGFVGLIITTMAFIIIPLINLGSLSIRKFKDEAFIFYSAAIILFFVTHNILEATIAYQAFPTWIFQLIVVASLADAVKAHD
jgi:exopolysaccharide production protein ExoQ